LPKLDFGLGRRFLLASATVLPGAVTVASVTARLLFPLLSVWLLGIRLPIAVLLRDGRATEDGQSRHSKSSCDPFLHLFGVPLFFYRYMGLVSYFHL
jgi:hypothetical protein